LFPLFAAGIVDTGGKLPPVSTTLAKLVAKFAACVVDSTLTCEISANVLKKFETVLMGYSGAGGKLIHAKARSKKSCDTVPLKPLSGFLKFYEA
jgi:hypothetical protein